MTTNKRKLIINRVYQIRGDSATDDIKVRYAGGRAGIVIASNHEHLPMGAYITRITLNDAGQIDGFVYQRVSHAV